MHLIPDENAGYSLSLDAIIRRMNRVRKPKRQGVDIPRLENR